jgi:hypothetical protein
MKLRVLPLIAISASVFFWSCGGSGSGTGGQGENGDSLSSAQGSVDALQMEKNGIKLSAVMGSPEYPDAAISLTEPAPGVDLEPGKNKFKFELKNFVLGEQTADAATKGLANSKDGQHIHVLLNNAPYMAHYKPELEEDLKEGHYVMLSFLSRSYHESIKSPNAFVVRQFVVGQPTYKEADLKAPHMFYSRPKGTYKPGDYNKLLLDFFLLNCELSADGYKVRATINGTEFVLTKWVPYTIEGLKPGEVTLKLELLDKDNNLVPSPFNPVERKVTLEANA